MGIDTADFDGNGTEDVVRHAPHPREERRCSQSSARATSRIAAPRSACAGAQRPVYRLRHGLPRLRQRWLARHRGRQRRRARDRGAAARRAIRCRCIRRSSCSTISGNGKFEEITPAAGPAFELSEVGRGLAVGDLDNDGAIDFVVNNNNGPLRVFRNRVGAKRDWLGLRLLTGKRDAYGAKVEIRRKGAPTIWRRVRADGSYLSANDPRILIGLGGGAQLEALFVHWPDGSSEQFPVPALRTYTTLVQR